MADLLLPMTGHIALCVALYGLLTLARAPEIWGLGIGLNRTGRLAAIEPRVSANLRNQFEWPVFFHLICMYIVLLERPSDPLQIGLAWTFVLGRFAHSAVQIFTANVRLRGLVFSINFLAVVGLWVHTVTG